MHISQKNTVSHGGHGMIPVGAGLAFADKYFETGGVTMTYL
jgi:pyruvate dehydrogenase E1 component alpha subunit